MLKLVDFFSGCGGFARGATAAGLNVVAAYDIDPILSSSFSRNFPNTEHILADISDLSATQVIQSTGTDIDGVFGGPPCQGFSTIGKRSATDPRRLLLGHYFRLVNELQPKFFVMENVLGLGQGEAAYVLADAMSNLVGSYAIFGPTVLCASNFGAATKRPRLFVVGIRKDLNFTMEDSDFKPFYKAPATVADAIRDLAGAIPASIEKFDDTWRIVSTEPVSDYARKLRSNSLTFTGNSRTKHSNEVMKRFAAVPQGGMDKIGRHPRLSWSGQCPTLRAGTGSDKGSFQSVRPIHPVEHRVITVREAARLQGFPDAHEFHSTIWHSFRMIGNSVSPIVATAVFKAINKKILRAAETNESAA
jgi:DNA (cytosine-5)-methyltransferase 1